jgi:hypothetical protein
MNLSEIVKKLEAVNRIDWTEYLNWKPYTLKAYRMNNIIRIDIKES